VRERGIASAQEAASNTPLLAAGFFIILSFPKHGCDFYLARTVRQIVLQGIPPQLRHLLGKELSYITQRILIATSEFLRR
jgi:hypothetical protein